MSEIETDVTNGEPAADTPAPEGTSDKSDSLDDLIRKAIDGEVELSGDDETPNRGRDERGRFTAKQQDDTAPNEATDPPAETAEQKPTEPTPEPGQVTDGHFRGWSPEERAKFQALPKDTQDFVLSRQKAVEGAFQQQVGELSASAKATAPLVETARKHSDYFRAINQTPDRVLDVLVQTERTLRYGSFAEKQALFAQMAWDYGIPYAPAAPEDPFNPVAPGGEHYPMVHDLRSELEQVKASYRGIQEQLRQNQTDNLRQHIESFRSETDANGNPKHPHFDRVQKVMGAILDRGEASSMEEAYQLATKPINDAVKAELERARQEAAAAQRAAVEKAKRAVPVRASGMVPGGRTAPTSLDSLISSSLDRAGWN